MQHFRGVPGTSVRERDPGNILSEKAGAPEPVITYPMESLFRSLGVQRENAEKFKVLNDTDSKCTNSLSGCDWFKVYTYLIKVHVVFLWIKKTNNSLAFNCFSLDATQGTSVHWSELVTWAQHN